MNLVTSRKAKIQINGRDVFLAAGKHAVAELKRLGGVPMADEISEVKDGKFLVLPDDGHVRIEGGEIFISNVRSSPSS